MKPYIGLKSKKQQNISADDVQVVVEVLNSNTLTQGPFIERFENATLEYCGAKYAVAVNSATSALHLTCLALGLKPGDTVWTTPNTFVASANCALYCGASVDFVDIDPIDYNMDVTKLAEKLALASKQNTLPKIIIPVHFSGQSAHMRKIRELANQYGCYVIEDASHAVGGEYLGKKVGCSEYSDAVIFSFHPVKIITSGEGGMVLTNNPELAARIYQLRSHGITRDDSKMASPSDGPWYYQQIDLGYNYRMTDIHAALGLNQLKRVDEFVKTRTQIAAFYHQELQNLPFKLPFQHADAKSSWHLYVIRLDLDKCKSTRREIFEALWEHSVPVNVHYIPVHTQPYYQARGFKVGDFPCAERHYTEALSLPIHCNLEAGELEHIVQTIKDVVA